MPENGASQMRHLRELGQWKVFPYGDSVSP